MSVLIVRGVSDIASHLEDDLNLLNTILTNPLIMQLHSILFGTIDPKVKHEPYIIDIDNPLVNITNQICFGRRGGLTNERTRLFYNINQNGMRIKLDFNPINGLAIKTQVFSHHSIVAKYPYHAGSSDSIFMILDENTWTNQTLKLNTISQLLCDFDYYKMIFLCESDHFVMPSYEYIMVPSLKQDIKVALYLSHMSIFCKSKGLCGDVISELIKMTFGKIKIELIPGYSTKFRFEFVE